MLCADFFTIVVDCDKSEAAQEKTRIKGGKEKKKKKLFKKAAAEIILFFLSPQ